MARFEFVDDEPNQNQNAPVSSQNSANRFQFIDQQETPPESKLKQGLRIGAQTIARPVQEIVGIPGNLMRFLADYGTTAAEKISGKQFPTFRKGLEDTAAFKLLPTSETAGKAISSLTGGYSDPQSDDEKTYGDIVGLGTLLLTGAQNPSKWQTFAKETARALGVIGAGKAAEAVGAGEVGKAATELGTLAISSLYRPKAIQEYLGKQYEKIRQSPVAKRLVPSSALEKSLESLDQQWSKGGTTPASRAAKGKLEELKKIASKGHVEVDELLDSYKKINSEIQDRNLFDTLDKSGRMQLRKHFDELKTAVSKQIEQTTPKEFSSEWQSINQGYSTFAKSRQAADWINSHKGAIAKALGTGLASELYFASGTLPYVAGAAATGLAVKSGVEVFQRVMNSPKLRQYYIESLKHITQENGPAALKSMEKLRMATEKEGH